ncbi:intraflagellar transport protein 57 homolog [Centruroides vittatus]|uniref:intraflagellar transport protein 57 homolog n=1 Tax=Centruroides vittatus TaxID=120091 RepID=UPI00350F3D52
MGEERKRDENLFEDGGPGQLYMSFVAMDDLLDKLKLLNYDKEFCRELKVKFLNRHYFALQTNPGEQFFIFTALSAWLIRTAGRSFETPQEDDDPNSTISNILDVLRNMGAAIDFPPSRLKSGFGSEVIYVLNCLADQALKAIHFGWNKAIHPVEDVEEENLIDDNAEVTLEKIEEEMLIEDDDDDDDDDEEGGILDLEGLRNLPLSRTNAAEINKPEDIMESTIDSAEWKLEVEKVLPQLKVTLRPDAKDWRSHIEQMHQHRKDIGESLSVTRNQLDKLHLEITRTLEKIGSREKYLNNQLEQMLLEYRASQDQLAQTKEQYRSVSGGVTERSRILGQITEELEQIKQEMEERGSSMTDGTPLVNVRKALARLKSETAQTDVRIGVAAHTLLRAKLKEKGNLQRAADPLPAAADFDSVF